MQEVIVRAAQPRERDFRFYLFFKRAFDLIVSGTALLLLSWLFLVLALVVKCSDGGRVFYRHERVGLNGKPIRLAKFRSMRRGADAPGALTPEQRAAYLREYKLDDDPRVTRVGKFLRKTSLDELPNLFAVFRGELSLVGPRPLMEEEAEAKYGILREKLLSVKPGVVGWWAVNGRSNCTYESGARQRAELYYVDHRSARLDLRILFRAALGAIRREGAR